MAFSPQQIYPIDFEKSVAVGVNLPFNGPAVFTLNYLTKDAIKNNLINFFLTNPGERYLNPSFGGGLRDFIFEQISEGNLNTLEENIENKLQFNFPNVKVEDLTINPQDDINQITVILKYSIINTTIVDNLEIQFT